LNIPASQFNTLTYYSFDDCSSFYGKNVWVFNIYGGAVSFSGGSLPLPASNAVYNIYSTSPVSVTASSTSLNGGILAPLGNMVFSSGSLTGKVYAASFQTSSTGINRPCPDGPQNITLTGAISGSGFSNSKSASTTTISYVPVINFAGVISGDTVTFAPESVDAQQTTIIELLVNSIGDHFLHVSPPLTHNYPPGTQFITVIQASSNRPRQVQSTNLLDPATITGISAGIVSAIVVAVVAGFIIMGVAGKKGVDYWRASTAPVIVTNPLYEAHEKRTTNPIYEAESDSFEMQEIPS